MNTEWHSVGNPNSQQRYRDVHGSLAWMGIFQTEEGNHRICISFRDTKEDVWLPVYTSKDSDNFPSMEVAQSVAEDLVQHLAQTQLSSGGLQWKNHLSFGSDAPQILWRAESPKIFSIQPLQFCLYRMLNSYNPQPTKAYFLQIRRRGESFKDLGTPYETLSAAMEAAVDFFEDHITKTGYDRTQRNIDLRFQKASLSNPAAHDTDRYSSILYIPAQGLIRFRLSLTSTCPSRFTSYLEDIVIENCKPRVFATTPLNLDKARSELDEQAHCLTTARMLQFYSAMASNEVLTSALPIMFNFTDKHAPSITACDWTAVDGSKIQVRAAFSGDGARLVVEKNGKVDRSTPLEIFKDYHNKLVTLEDLARDVHTAMQTAFTKGLNSQYVPEWFQDKTVETQYRTAPFFIDRNFRKLLHFQCISNPEEELSCVSVVELPTSADSNTVSRKLRLLQLDKTKTQRTAQENIKQLQQLIKHYDIVSKVDTAYWFTFPLHKINGVQFQSNLFPLTQVLSIQAELFIPTQGPATVQIAYIDTVHSTEPHVVKEQYTPIHKATLLRELEVKHFVLGLIRTEQQKYKAATESKAVFELDVEKFLQPEPGTTVKAPPPQTTTKEDVITWLHNNQDKIEMHMSLNWYQGKLEKVQRFLIDGTEVLQSKTTHEP